MAWLAASGRLLHGCLSPPRFSSQTRVPASLARIDAPAQSACLPLVASVAARPRRHSVYDMLTLTPRLTSTHSQVWLDGMEVTQFTYFQQAGGKVLEVPSVEITYGLERILMSLQVVRFQSGGCGAVAWAGCGLMGWASRWGGWVVRAGWRAGMAAPSVLIGGLARWCGVWYQCVRYRLPLSSLLPTHRLTTILAVTVDVVWRQHDEQSALPSPLTQTMLDCIAPLTAGRQALQRHCLQPGCDVWRDVPAERV